MTKSIKTFLGIFLLGIIVSFSLVGCGGKNSSNKDSNKESKTTSKVDKSENNEESSNKIKFTDLLGREVELDGPAKKILLGFYAESFIAVNGGLDNVACISKAEWEDFFNGQYRAYVKNVPELEKIIDTGSVYKGSFSMETTLNIAPDVAILAPFQYETLGENIDKLEKAGTKVVVLDYNAQTLEKHILSTQIIGKITGKNDRAQQLADEYKQAFEEVQKRVAKLSDDEKKRVYVELGNLGASEIGNSYGDYMWGSLVKVAGGKNVAEGKVASYGALSPEYILSSDPEMMIFAGSKWVNDTGNRVKIGFEVDSKETSERIKPYTERKGWSDLSAIKNGEVYAVDHASLRSIYDYTYLQFIAKSLYPELFEDINPEENLAKFYEKYLPLEAKGCFMTKLQK